MNSSTILFYIAAFLFFGSLMLSSMNLIPVPLMFINGVISIILFIVGLILGSK